MNPAPVATRYFYLDWVRIAAFGLLVLYHVGMYYVSWDWHVKSPHAGSALEPLMFLTSPWRLSLLFLVSGVATAFLIGKTRSGFFAARSRRLLIPLIFGMLVIVPPQAYYEVVEKINYAGGYLSFYARYLSADGSFCRDGECLALPTWNHLWFVAYLWTYTVLVWAALRLAPSAMQSLDRHVSAALSGVGLLVWPALLLALVRIGLVGIFESTHDLVEDWYNHAQYLSVFMLGFCIARADQVWQAAQRLRWPALLLASASYLFLIWYFFSATSDSNPPGDALRTFQRTVWGLNQWTSILAILGFARHLSPGDSPLRRYLSDAVFPVYILHQSIIVIFAHNLKPFGIAPTLEGCLLVIATFACCFAGYEVIRRVGWLRPLFGLKAAQTPVAANATAALQS